MNASIPILIVLTILFILFWALIFSILILTIRALIKYLQSKSIKKEDIDFYKSLGEALKNARVQNNMTQEYVASSLNVSRQAVSKWENGTSDPSTTNLIALSKLYNVSADSLLKGFIKKEV
ncbi:helix-turn-helix domain-containing protein [Anaerorhabdus furcosa]|uniref:DNA-binding transcriptional regulator, XRE-family HTH domain n=1 Tax=Anaerorhabdus furcosa TaxID=118967 RepID=A0A1T4LHB1_9FIRM|nr:helix-turn-helix transcriptional regulator [Anaerorhabdus furcosa]SJZ54172.1 DNA-binding transcriptional regulator, XRE-family HTH domain [Anaerorhabdus furcosa]